MSLELPELTEEEIKQGFEPMYDEAMFGVSLEPLHFLPEGVVDFDDPIEEEKARKFILKFTFSHLGFNPETAKLFKEERVKATEEGKEDFVEQYFETENPDLLIVYNGKDFWVRRKEEMK